MPIRPTPFSSLLLGALSILALPSSQANADQTPFDGTRLDTSWDPSEFPASPSQHTVVGHLSELNILDVAGIVDGQIHLYKAPAVLDHREITPWAANHLDVAPGQGPQGLDALVFVNANGLHLGWIDPLDGSYQSSVLESSVWIGAQRVQWKIDETQLAVVGIDSTGYSVITHGVSGFGSSLGASGQDLAFIDWNADQNLDLAVLTDQWIRVYDSSGIILFHAATAVGPAHWMSVFRENTALPHRLAVALPGATEEFLVVADSASMTGVPIGNTILSDAMSGDFDGDGRDDLLCACQDNDPFVLINIHAGQGATFSPNHAVILDVDGSQESGAPVLGDFDSDGSLDAFTDTGLSSSIHRQIPLHSAPSPTLVNYEQALQELTFVVPAPTAPFTITHLELLVFFQAQGSQSISPVAVSRTLVPLSENQTYVSSVLLTETTVPWTHRYPCLLRAVSLDQSGAIDQTGVPYIGIVVGNQADLIDVLEAAPDPGVTLTIDWNSDPGSSDSGGSVPGPKLGGSGGTTGGG